MKLPSFYEECRKSFAGCFFLGLIQWLRVFSGLFMPSVVMLERAHLVARVSSQCIDGKTMFLNHWGKREFLE